MLKLKNRYLFLMAAAIIMLLPSDAFAGGFDSLKDAGKTIFLGLREIIYPASAVGIIAVCLGGFFGNINWKWLTAIVVGLVVISCCAGFVELFVGDAADDIPANVMNGS